MLLSMTGYGAGKADRERGSVVVEIRAVNNRYLKLHCRLPDGYATWEPRIEAVVREHIRRGSVQLNVDLKRAPSPDDYRINVDLVQGYYRQLRQLQEKCGEVEPIRWDSLLLLPGAVSDQPLGTASVEEDWQMLEPALKQALKDLQGMRETEGAAMTRDLQDQCDQIARCVDEITARAPLVAASYQQRLTDRLNKLLVEHDVQVQPADVVHEVGLFAERTDISEEIVRLRSHLDQFGQIMTRAVDGGGRKLEFVVQELLRETNTIGSKANDAEIARQVVHVKTCLERIREMVQNVE